MQEIAQTFGGIDQSVDNFSTIQKGIFLSQAKYPNSSLYNVCGYALLEGNVDVSLLIEAVKLLLNSCDIVTICDNYFLNENSRVLQNKLDIDLIDYSNSANADYNCMKWMSADAKI